MKKTVFCIAILLFIAVFSVGVAAEDNSTADLSASNKLIAITFDDGPSSYTTKLLNALDKYDNAHVTFFVLGSKVSNYSSTISRAYESGHQIAGHSWNHTQLTTLSASGVKNDSLKTANAIKKVTGQSTVYMRPPYGSYNNTVLANVGGPVIYWSVDTLDWKYRNANTVKNAILNNASDGAIVLLHDIHPTTVDGFIAALPTLISRGYELVTVEELLYRRGITAKNGTVYFSAPNKGTTLPAKNYDGAEYDESKLDQHWAYEYICYVKEKGLFNGVSETKFAPDKYMTRAMFVTVLSRLSNEEMGKYSCSFKDVKAGEWYTDAVAWAAANGIVNGISETEFNPDGFVTREQMCAMLARYSAYAGIELQQTADKITFKDDSKISSYAKSSVYAMQQSEIIFGVGDNKFSPTDKSTRAQVATLFSRYCMKYIDITNEETPENGESENTDDLVIIE